LVKKKVLNETSYAGKSFKMPNEERVKLKNEVFSKFQNIIKLAEDKRKELFAD